MSAGARDLSRFCGAEKPRDALQVKGRYGSRWARADGFGLSKRECEVMERLAQGLLYKEIADNLNVSYGAVHKLQHKIFLKLQVTNRTEAVVKWLGSRGG